MLHRFKSGSAVHGRCAREESYFTSEKEQKPNAQVEGDAIRHTPYTPLRHRGGNLNSNLMRAEQIIISCDKVTAAKARRRRDVEGSEDIGTYNIH